jgi:phosphosulfolactate synthase
LNHDEKLELIQRLAKTRTVLSEVGSKDSGILISPGRWIKMMSSELKQGHGKSSQKAVKQEM